jgi:hypothetical protein
MKKLVVVFLLSSMIPLCAMKAGGAGVETSAPSPRPGLAHSDKARRFLGLTSQQYLVAFFGTGAALGIQGVRRHVKNRHARGEKTIFDQMWRWMQWVVRRKKTTSADRLRCSPFVD